MLFVSNAFAQASNAGEPNPMITILMFAGLFGFMYFLIIRPQRKRQKEHNELVGALGKGDEVVTTSGMLGKITKLEGDYVVLEVSNNLELKFQKVAVHAVACRSADSYVRTMPPASQHLLRQTLTAQSQPA